MATTDSINMPKKISSIANLKFDDKNANRGTHRGRELLAESLSKLGAGRSIVCDRHGFVIGGNKTLESAQKLGLEIEVIHTQGDKLVAVIRDDLDLKTDAKARELALADNRISELDLNWDIEQLLQDVDEFSIEGLWNEAELQRLQDSLDLQEFEAIASDADSDEPDNADGDTKKSTSKADSNLVQFHVLLAPEQRERLFDAIKQAKGKHGLETTADALDVIVQEYLHD